MGVAAPREGTYWKGAEHLAINVGILLYDYDINQILQDCWKDSVSLLLGLSEGQYCIKRKKLTLLFKYSFA